MKALANIFITFFGLCLVILLGWATYFCVVSMQLDIQERLNEMPKCEAAK